MKMSRKRIARKLWTIKENLKALKEEIEEREIADMYFNSQDQLQGWLSAAVLLLSQAEEHTESAA